jgi:hypothetical protein
VVEATRIATIELRACEKTGLDQDQAATQTVSDNPLIWKDKAKKWQQFITQVTVWQNGKTLGIAAISSIYS